MVFIRKFAYRLRENGNETGVLNPLWKTNFTTKTITDRNNLN